MSRILNTVRSRKNRTGRKGFTLIELLVVVLILAILMSVALPLYLSAVSDSQKKTCRSNMQTIGNAVQAAKIKDLAADYSGYMGAVSTTTTPDLQTVPICPNAGTYSVAAGDGGGPFQVECTATGHGSFEPGVDSN
jgi:type IV pilus assembly protein PilA